MIKKFALLTLSILMVVGLKAQEVQDTVLKIGVQTVPGFIVSMPQDVKTVQNALNQKLKNAKLSTTKSEGYIASLEQVVPEIATVPVNLYVKIEESGRRSDKVTVVTLCAMPMNIADKISDSYVRRYLEDLIKQVKRQEAEEMLAQSEKDLKKAQKEYKNASSDLEKLNKNINSDQAKMASNQKDIEKLQGKIKDLEDKNAKLESSVNKNSEQKANLEKRASESQNALQELEKKVESYRAMLQ